jgi:hypothetical protein
MWKNYFSQLVNLLRVNEVSQLEIHAAELLVPEPNPSALEIDISEPEKA